MNPSGHAPHGEAKDSNDAAGRAARRQQLDEVFGDVLPTATRDEIDDGQDAQGQGEDRDQWYRDNRPPHHG